MRGTGSHCQVTQAPREILGARQKGGSVFSVEDKVMGNLKAHSKFAAGLSQREKLVF